MKLPARTPAALRRHRMPILFGLAVIATILFLRLALQPLLVHSLGSSFRIVRAVSTVQGEVGMDSLQADLDAKRKLLARVRAVRNSLPAVAKPSIVMDSVISSAKSNGLTIRDVVTMSMVPADQWNEIPLQVSVDGSFEELHKWMRSLESGSMVFRVRSWQIVRTAPGGVQAQVSVSAFLPKVSP